MTLTCCFTGVGMVMRKLGATTKPTQYISVDGDKWNIKTVTTFKSSELSFTLNEPFQETTIDGRNVTVRGRGVRRRGRVRRWGMGGGVGEGRETERGNFLV